MEQPSAAAMAVIACLMMVAQLTLASMMGRAALYIGVASTGAGTGLFWT